VEKPANKKPFVCVKGDDGGAQVTTQGKVIFRIEESHQITGIVYESMVEDAHGDFMNPFEIKDAAHWFTKNGNYYF